MNEEPVNRVPYASVVAFEDDGGKHVSEAVLKLYEARIFEDVPYRLHYELPI